MRSHEYAQKLHEIAEFLESRTEFETNTKPRESFYFWFNKEDFLAAVKSLGSGKKVFSGSDLRYEVSGAPISVVISRDKVCRKVRDEEWECEPLLSPQEEETLTPIGEDIPF